MAGEGRAALHSLLWSSKRALLGVLPVGLELTPVLNSNTTPEELLMRITKMAIMAKMLLPVHYITYLNNLLRVTKLLSFKNENKISQQSPVDLFETYFNLLS